MLGKAVITIALIAAAFGLWSATSEIVTLLEDDSIERTVTNPFGPHVLDQSIEQTKRSCCCD